MTAAVIGAQRGRPSIDGLQGSLERVRVRNADLEDELLAQTRENLVFADRVRRGADRLRTAFTLDRWDMVDQVAGELGHAAERRMRQSGGIL